MANQYNSQSQQNFNQQPNQQQQWMAYQQQQGNAASMQNMMAQHQAQWQEHMAAQQQNNQSTSAINLNQPQQNNYLQWQQQYQNQQLQPNSAMNMNQYQSMQQLQQQNAMQRQAMMAQQNAIRQQQIGQSQRALFQQQARNNKNYFASTGNLPNNNQQINASANPNFLSQNAIYDKKRGKLEEDEEMDFGHESFVPPAPQNKQEIDKYVHWQAKRKGIDNQKTIDAQIQKREKMSALATEQNKEKNFKMGGTVSKKNSYTEPLLPGHKDSDIDYECLDQQNTNAKSGCCCVVM